MNSPILIPLPTRRCQSWSVRIVHPVEHSAGTLAFDFSSARPFNGSVAVALQRERTTCLDDHRTENDILDKIAPEDLAHHSFVYAAFARLTAHSPVRFGSGPGLLE
ncbi:MAG: hypothetical protein GVY11_00240 [Gammaproteobacteria bacterium]|jgi:predicted RNase H-like nuclease|nr:hypothetical protein [Gammaproteobacteria bacterium]